MAKIRIKPNENIDDIATRLAQAGNTVDKHRLAPNTYRVYVRKENMQRFSDFINSLNQQ